MRAELRKKIKEANREYKRVQSLLTPYGFTLCTTVVFYGEPPFSLYCGKMEDYQKLIDNINDIKERYNKHKKENLGI
ncbi:MAG: hypothetical protein RR444_12305 [Oscillospiraceae bacterium]